MQPVHDRLVLRGHGVARARGFFKRLLGELGILRLGLWRFVRHLPRGRSGPSAGTPAAGGRGVGLQLDRQSTGGLPTRIDRHGRFVQLRIAAAAGFALRLCLRSKLGLQLLKLPGDLFEQCLNILPRGLLVSRRLPCALERLMSAPGSSLLRHGCCALIGIARSTL